MNDLRLRDKVEFLVVDPSLAASGALVFDIAVHRARPILGFSAVGAGAEVFGGHPEHHGGGVTFVQMTLQVRQ